MSKENPTDSTEEPLDVSTDKPPDTTRRDVLKAGAGAATALALGSASASPAAADHTDTGTWLEGAAFGPVGLAYVAGQAYSDHNTGPDRDLSGFQGGDSLHIEQEDDVLELKGTEEEVLTEVRNIIDRGEVAATMDGKKAFITAYNAGDTRTQCQAAAETAVDDFWSNRQQSVVSRFEQAARLIHRRFTEVESNGNLSLENVWEVYSNDAKDNAVSELGSDHFNTLTDNGDARATFTCFNGLEVPYTWYETYDSHSVVDPFGRGSYDNAPSNPKQGSFEFRKYSDGGLVIALDTILYRQIMDRIVTARDRTVANMATYVDEAFSGLERGEITTDDLLNHYDVQQEFATNKETTGYHAWLAWAFFSLGFEADLQHNAVLSFPETEDSQQLKGTLFLSDAEPIGGTIEAGKTHDPTQWGGEMAYFTYARVVTDASHVADREQTVEEHDDGSLTVIGKMQIGEKFTVEKLVNVQTGNEVDSTTTTETNDQNYDPSELQNEIERLNNKITQMQENAEESQDGGGSGFSAPDIKWWQAGGVGAVLLGGLYAMSSGKVGDLPDRRGR